jgi:hypothetical protein
MNVEMFKNFKYTTAQLQQLFDKAGPYRRMTDTISVLNAPSLNYALMRRDADLLRQIVTSYSNGKIPLLRTPEWIDGVEIIRVFRLWLDVTRDGGASFQHATDLEVAKVLVEIGSDLRGWPNPLVWCSEEDNATRYKICEEHTSHTTLGFRHIMINVKESLGCPLTHIQCETGVLITNPDDPGAIMRKNQATYLKMCFVYSYLFQRMAKLDLLVDKSSDWWDHFKTMSKLGREGEFDVFDVVGATWSINIPSVGTCVVVTRGRDGGGGSEAATGEPCNAALMVVDVDDALDDWNVLRKQLCELFAVGRNATGGYVMPFCSEHMSMLLPDLLHLHNPPVLPGENCFTAKQLICLSAMPLS